MGIITDVGQSITGMVIVVSAVLIIFGGMQPDSIISSQTAGTALETPGVVSIQNNDANVTFQGTPFAQEKSQDLTVAGEQYENLANEEVEVSHEIFSTIPNSFTGIGNFIGLPQEIQWLTSTPMLIIMGLFLLFFFITIIRGVDL